MADNELNILQEIGKLQRAEAANAETLAALDGRLTGMAGEFSKVIGKLSELAASTPVAPRWCPPWKDETTGEVWCKGGVELRLSQHTAAKGEGKEWTHPIPEDSWHEVETVGGGTAMAKNHNVYESRALRSPPDDQSVPPRPGQAEPERAPDYAEDNGGGQWPRSTDSAYWMDTLKPVFERVIADGFNGNLQEFAERARTHAATEPFIREGSRGLYYSVSETTQAQAETAVAFLREKMPEAEVRG
tara:strand:+ start:886 stop:1620 length:735 start_codon:yes stop_codon:yes gene_type:complete